MRVFGLMGVDHVCSGHLLGGVHVVSLLLAFAALSTARRCQVGLAALASLWMRYSFALLEDFRGRKCSICYEFFLKAYLCGRPFLLKLLQALVLQCHMALLGICAVTLQVFFFSLQSFGSRLYFCI